MKNNKNLTIVEVFNLAIKNYQEGKIDIAQNLYIKILEINPNYADAHYNLGVIFQELRENQKAKDCFEKVIEIDPNYVNALNNLGVIFKELKENQKAKECFEKAIELKPDYVDAHNNLGVMFQGLGEYKKAKDCYEKAITINPNYVDAHNNLGVIFKELKENQKAKECFEKAIEINPNFADAYNNLGNIFKKLKENQKAKDCFEKSIKINPNYVNALNNLGNIFNELGEYQKAKDCFEKAIKINPNYVNALNNLGNIFNELGEYQKAKECFEKAIEINPNHAGAHNNLGVIFKNLEEYQKAKECYEKVIEIDPNYVGVHNNLNLLLKIKRLVSTIEQARKSEIKTKIGFFKKVPTKLSISGLRLTSNPFISNMKVEAELVSQLYKINSKKLDDVDLKYLRYGNGRSSDYELFENNFSTIKTVEKDLVNIMKEAVKSDIFIMESFFNIFQTESGIISHNHVSAFDYNSGLLNQKFSLTYYLDIGDQNCSEPGILKLEDPDEKILPTEGMIVIFPANRMHSAIYNGRKDRVMIGINFYSLI
jgi:tetratricopeptide (TPR) repeat protein